ncbi:NnrU family protein [Histidinibacterium lentulum]|uniref:NnrU domain-containing protein n=1 Tax=Histidinibacterium lentulum TaxID=2480588 RepID=A0A3N2R105_9RHOB|nr:NnrU family protein [Histidinibacterium lentulum]ROU01154.1 hypothetical protein EAT49_11570 [Histidinibacterium lentulum]
MVWLILGVALWWAAHFFKRAAPGPRAKLGDAGKGGVALALVVSLLLMWWGYRTYFGPVWWGRSAPLVGVNNLLMVAAFYIYASGATPPGRPRNRVGTMLRHPQLIGFSLFCVAHLVVNGDLASFILFGGLLIWALTEIVVINRLDPAWERPAWGGVKSEVRIAVIAAVIFAIVALIHGWVGPWPFG